MHRPLPALVAACMGIMLAGLLAACASTPVPVPADPVGQARYERLPVPEGSQRYQVEPGTIVQQPHVRINPDPVYPPALPALDLPPVELVARLSVDAQGKVTATWVSRYRGDAAHRQAFVDAVDTATAQWRFKPLVFTSTATGGNGPPVTRSVAKPFSAWFRFRFEVVNGKPQASSRKAPRN